MVPDIQPVLLGDARMRDSIAAFGSLLEFRIPLVVGERIPAGRHELQHLVEPLAQQALIGRGARHLAIELVGVERSGAGRAEHMLGQHVERARPRGRRVLRALFRRFEGCLAFHHLEAVGRHQQRLARLVQPVVGAADALRQPACALRRADIDDEIDLAPVDAEIERRGADHGAELALNHRRLDFPPLRHVERAVMQGDRQIGVVVAPQLVEQHLGLRARIDEDQRQAMRLDRRVDLGQRIARRVPGPRQLGIGAQDGDIGARPLACGDDLGESRRRLPLMRHQERGKLVRPRHGRRQADRRKLGRMRAQPRQIERQQIAALAGGERVQLIEDHIFQAAEQLGRAFMRQHQRDLLRRGQQNVGRQPCAAARAARAACRRCESRA